MFAIDDPHPSPQPPRPRVIAPRQDDVAAHPEPARRTGRRAKSASPRSQPKRPLHITLDQLRIFSAVAEREHLTGAAQALRLSQGTVSVQVRRLERALGLPLLHRVGRNVRLTDIGRAVHRGAREALQSAQTIEDLAAAYLQEERGEVAVAAGRVIGAHRLSGWLGPFVQAHPRADVHITIAPLPDAMASLASGAVDVVIVGAAPQMAGVETIALERTELVIVVAAQHPLATHPRPLDELRGHRHLAHEQGSATQTHVAEVLADLAGLPPATELEEGTLLAALRTGLGFAVMPRAIVETEIAAGTLTILERPGRPVPVVFTAVRRAGPHTPIVETFWKHLQKLAPQ